MGNSNKKKERLGMAPRTASARLRKELLWKYVCLAGDNICYRCEEPIEEIDDLTVDHKTAWLNSNNPPKFFFALDNVAFSHLSCNSQHNWENKSDSSKERKRISLADNTAQEKLRKTNPKWKEDQRRRNAKIGNHSKHIRQQVVGTECEFCDGR